MICKELIQAEISRLFPGVELPEEKPTGSWAQLWYFRSYRMIDVDSFKLSFLIRLAWELPPHEDSLSKAKTEDYWLWRELRLLGESFQKKPPRFF